jgi:hypothetical protein
MNERLVIFAIILGCIAVLAFIVIVIARALAQSEFLFCIFPPPGTFCSIENQHIPQYILDGDTPPTLYDGPAYFFYKYAGAHWIGLFNNVATHSWLVMSVEASTGDNPEGASDVSETHIKNIPKKFPNGIDIPDADKDALRVKILLESEYSVVSGKEQEFLNYIHNTPNWLTVLICSSLIALTKEYVRDQTLPDIKGADCINLVATNPKNFQNLFMTGMRTILATHGFLEITKILQLDVIAENAVETNNLFTLKRKAELEGAALVETAKAKTQVMEETKQQAMVQKDIDMLGVDVQAAYVKTVLEPAAKVGALGVLEQTELTKMTNLTVLVQKGASGSVIVQPPTPPTNNTANSGTPPNQGGGNV